MSIYTGLMLTGSPTLPHSVVLYSCPRLAVDCSTCIGLNDNFNCAYCTSTDSGSCMLSTLTCSPGPLIRPLNSTCPTPTVTEVCMLCYAMNILIFICTLALWYSLWSGCMYVHIITFYHFSSDLSTSWSC